MKKRLDIFFKMSRRFNQNIRTFRLKRPHVFNTIRIETKPSEQCGDCLPDVYQ